MSSSRKIMVKSMDGEAFEVEEVVAMQSNTIKDLIEDDPVVTLPSITGKILAMVIDYCEKHAGEASNNEDHLRAWDAEFVEVDEHTLFDLILAANFLNIRSLLDLTCQTVADMIRGRTPEEIRKTFNIEITFTPEEQEEVRRENAWAFE